ncbi:MAG: hypothetical protein AB1390_09245 [Nitrospirota bacterium]
MNMLNKESLSSENVLNLIRKVCKENYGDDNIHAVEKVLSDVRDLFGGKRRGFLRCDTRYHDIFHTLLIIHPFTGIIDGWNKSGKDPKIPKEMFTLGLIAVFLHDTGYIKKEGDIEGTGGKYTFIHIKRSAEFADHYLSSMGFSQEDIVSVKNMIMCTGVKVNFEKILFNSREERLAGYALGTADLIGQMSAEDYIEKLPALYHEYEEAYSYEGKERLRERGVVLFSSADDLIRRTPHFYEVTVKERFEKMGSMHQYLTHHFKDSRNHFIDAIENNIRIIKLAALIQ